MTSMRTNTKNHLRRCKRVSKMSVQLMMSIAISRWAAVKFRALNFNTSSGSCFTKLNSSINQCSAAVLLHNNFASFSLILRRSILSVDYCSAISKQCMWPNKEKKECSFIPQCFYGYDHVRHILSLSFPIGRLLCRQRKNSSIVEYKKKASVGRVSVNGPINIWRCLHVSMIYLISYW